MRTITDAGKQFQDVVIRPLHRCDNGRSRSVKQVYRNCVACYTGKHQRPNRYAVIE